MSQITVLFVDDHPLIRKAWAFILKQDLRFKLLGVCGSGEEAVEKSSQLCPDVVIMDIRMSGMSGIEATQRIHKNCPATKIIGLSFHVLPEYARDIIQKGASGYLTKFSSPEEIFKAIIEVHNGNSFICKDMADEILISAERSAGSY